MDNITKEKRLYIVKNLINGKVYGGKHNWHPNTKYMGSGYALKKAFNKYGKENFSIRWLKLKIKSPEHLDRLEIRMIRLLKYKFGNRCYNIQKGGCGGYFIYYMNEEQRQEVFKKISEGKKKQYAKGETKKQIEGKKRMREKRLAQYKDPVMKKVYDDSQIKRVESLKRRRATMGATDKEIKRHKELIKHSRVFVTYKILFPDGSESIETKSIGEFIDHYKTDWDIFTVARKEGKFLVKFRSKRTKHPFPIGTQISILKEVKEIDM
jgi:hypothetical protein